MAMNGKSRWLGLVLVVVVFVTGAVAGIAADRTVRPALLEGRSGLRGADQDRRGPDPRRQGPGAPRVPRGAGALPLLDRVELTEVQRARVDSILETRRRQVTALWREHEATFRAAMDSTQEELLSVLTPEQREEYHQMLMESRRRWQDRPGAAPGGTRRPSSPPPGGG